jgi:signal transduction histidine kinase
MPPSPETKRPEPSSTHLSEHDAETRAKQLCRLVHHLIRENDNEKARLARELHDELGSNLTAVNLDVASVEDKVRALDPALSVRLRRALESLRTVVGLSRRIIEDLRPSALDNMDLAEALRGHCEDLTERTGLECQADLSEELGELHRDSSIALFSVAQESLANAATHGKPSRVALSLGREGAGTRMRISDNGTGMPDNPFDRPAAHGLLEARERISMVGGTFEIRRGEGGKGTVVDVFVPNR